jgi:hypothetical protein
LFKNSHQNFVERYEAIVSDHQQYSKAVMDNQEWLEATHNTVLLWGDCDLERISLHSNIERLKVIIPAKNVRKHVDFACLSRTCRHLFLKRNTGFT